MKSKPLAPVLVGRGMAGQAILRSLAIVSQVDPELELLPVRIADRGAPLQRFLSTNASNVLFLANPSGLHAHCIQEGTKSGYDAIAADKPVCVRPEEIPLLRDVDGFVSVFHGYRAMWGSRKIKQMIVDGALGDVFAFESRYWQSSAAQTAMSADADAKSWKNNAVLNGPYDALTDLGSHVVDLCHHMMGTRAQESKCWVSYRNASAKHRDTHVHLQLGFTGSRHAWISISKTAHGAANDLEYTVFGTRGSATWKFTSPDEVMHGYGGSLTFIRRSEPNLSSDTKPFHGIGWLEGYVEITRQTLRRAAGLDCAAVPLLRESLDVMDVLLNARIET